MPLFYEELFIFKKSLLILSFLVIQLAAYAQDDLPETAKTINASLLAEITAQGQKVSAVALEYEGNLLSGSDLRKAYQIFTALEGKEQTPRTILRSYVNDKPETSAQYKAGKFVIIELDAQDKNADLYSLKTENDQPMKFKGKDKDGNIVEIEKKQATKVPQYYGEKLVYQINQTGYLKTNAKYFIVDNGLRRHAIGKKGANYANRLENIVFIELLRRGYSVDVGKLDSKEIDFIARKADEILYVQVAFEIPENTHETDNLLHIKDNYKKILITGKYYEQTEIEGIKVVYVVDWLLQ